MSWEKVRLKALVGELGFFCDGDWVETKDQDPSGDVRLIQLADIGIGRFLNKSKRFMTKERAQELKCTFLKRGDILIARMPDPIGRCCAFPFNEESKYVTVVDVAILRLSNAKVNIQYIIHYINSTEFQSKISSLITGTTRQRISRSKLENLEIPLAPFPIQEKIANILDKADELRRKDQELQAKYDELAQAIFIDMFGDPVRNEKGWDVKKLEDVVKNEKNSIVDGPFGSSMNESDYRDAGVPIIRIMNIRDSGFYEGNFRYISEEKYNRLIRSKVNYNDLLFARVGHTIGKVCVFNKSYNALLSTTGVAKASLNNEKLDVVFALSQLKLRSYYDYIKSNIQGAGQPYINLSKIKAFRIIVPPLPLQQAFAQKIEIINALKAEANAEKSEELFQSLLQRAFKGELVN